MACGGRIFVRLFVGFWFCAATLSMDEAGLDFWDFDVCRAWAAVCRPAAHLERHKRNGAKLGKAGCSPCAWKFGRRERGDVYGNGGAKGTGTI